MSVSAVLRRHSDQERILESQLHKFVWFRYEVVRLSRLDAQNVLAIPLDADRVRMVTHLDVTRPQIEAAADAVALVLG